ncbi:MAG: cupin domain-containing protein [Alphaproteobacteria bacterium]
MTYIHVHEDERPWGTAPEPELGALKTKLLLDGTGGSHAFRFGLARLAGGAATDPYTRPHAELLYIAEGTARIDFGAEEVTLPAQSCIYCPAGLPRSISAVGGGELRFAYTVSCERQPAAAAATSRPAWLKWEDAEDWWSVEPSKGLRIRVKRLLDRDVPRDLITGLGLIDPGTHYTLHYHDQPEIYYIVSGEGIVYVAGEEVSVRRGSCLDIGGKVVHGADSLGSEPLGIYYVYGCENAGHTVNWTAVETLYDTPRRAASSRG